MAKEEPVTDLKQVGLGLFAILLLFGTGVRVCGKPGQLPVAAPEPAPSADMEGLDLGNATTTTTGKGLSAPIAAAVATKGEVIVAGLDVPSKTIRIQRIDAKDNVVVDRVAFENVKWSTDSELKVAVGGDKVFVIWHGFRNNRIVRQLATLDPTLKRIGDPTDIASAVCTTKDALWSADETAVRYLTWGGDKGKIALPKDKDSSLLCAEHAAFGIIEDEDKTSFFPLKNDNATPTVALEASDFGQDEQRELAELNVGDELGFVRLGRGGTFAVKETKDGVPGELHRLKTKVAEDDDVVAVDADGGEIVVVYTSDVSATCPPDADGMQVSTRVQALRIKRATWEEKVDELTPGRCGIEVGPFFTAPMAKQSVLAVSYVERGGGLGKARAPIRGLAIAHLGFQSNFKHIPVEADALADGGCDESTCYAAALLRSSDGDASTPGFVKILRW
jgi:hypothetical protein